MATMTTSTSRSDRAAKATSTKSDTASKEPSQCLNEIVSTDRTIRRRGLKNLEQLVQTLDAETTLSHLSGGRSDTSETSHHSRALSDVLLTIIDDDETPEICREKSAVILQSCLHRVFGSCILPKTYKETDSFALSWQQKESKCHKPLENNTTATTNTNVDSSRTTSERVAFLFNFYIEFCSVFASRFSPHGRTSKESILKEGGKAITTTAISIGNDGSTTPKEPAEEIRLILVRIASDLFSYMNSCFITCKPMNDNEKLADDQNWMDGSISETMNIEILSYLKGRVNEKKTIHATSTLCRCIARTGLTDPYPTLKRECCIVVERMALLFPLVIRMNAESLLRPITGISLNAEMGTVPANSSRNTMTSSTSSSLLNTCLMRHRHAKTRCMALEVTVHILSCCCSSATSADQSTMEEEKEQSNIAPHIPGDHNHGNKKDDRVQEILELYILPCWEDLPPFDRAASVRMELVTSVGQVARMLHQNKDFDQERTSDEMHHLVVVIDNQDRKTLTSRLLILLLMGIADDSEDVHQRSMTELLAWAKLLERSTTECSSECVIASARAETLNFLMPSTEFGGVISRDDVLAARLVWAHFQSILPLLCQNASKNWAAERKVHALKALRESIRFVNRYLRASEQMELVSGCVLDNEYFSPPKSSSKEDSITSKSQLQILLTTLCDRVRDDEQSVATAALTCAQALGESKSSALSLLDLLLPCIRGTGAHNIDSVVHSHYKETNKNEEEHRLLLSTPQLMGAAISIVGHVVCGCIVYEETTTVSTGEKHNDRPPCSSWLTATVACHITSALSDRSVLDVASSNQFAAWALLDTCRAVVDHLSSRMFCEVGKSEDKDTRTDDKYEESDGNHDGNVEEGIFGLRENKQKICRNLLSCCVQILGCPESFGLLHPTMDLLEDLAEKNIGVRNGAELLRLYFRDIMDRITHDAIPEEGKVWETDSPEFRSFEALVRYSGGVAVGENFDLVSPVVERHLLSAPVSSTPSADDGDRRGGTGYSVKLSFMALLESALSDPTFPKEKLQPFTAKLLDSVIIPNLVWQVGGMASALRKLSAATLFSLLRGGGATAKCLFLTAPRLLPVLKSNLTDDDATTRELICASLQIIFRLLPGALGEEPVHQLYPDLIKCLDDSSDSVRFAAIDAITSFFRAAPANNFKGTAIEYMTKQLLVHLDDPDPQIQLAVLGALTVALDVDPDVVVKQSQEARLSHRTGHFCDILLQRAKEHLAKKKQSLD